MSDEPYNPDPRPDWFRCGVTASRFLHRLKAERDRPAEPPVASGDGVLYVGGGKFWPGIVVGCKLLRDLGCTLPVEVWYRGTCEPVDADDVAGLNVTLIDADQVSEELDDNRIPTGRVDKGGWEAKGYALTHTAFSRVLYLDADAYCVADPTPLFAAVTGAGAGLAYWRDFDTMGGNVKWEWVWPDGPAGVPPIQGGQLLIDRGRCEPALRLMHRMSQHSDFYYQHMFGDQDAWRVAAAATGVPLLDLGAADWDATAFVCRLSGEPLIVHRCQGKLFAPSDIPAGKTAYSNPQARLPLEGRVFDLLAETINRRQPSAAVFEEHYRRGLWGGGSGSGSAPAEARPFIDSINTLAGLCGWRSCVDVGCGDGRVARELAFAEYRGFDASPAAVALFAANAPGRSVEALDCYRDLESLPAADVLICRDVLHHWPNAWVTDWLTRVKRLARWGAVVLCQDVHQWHDGQDTYPGGYRALHPHLNPLKPFGLRLLSEHLHKAVLIL